MAPEGHDLRLKLSSCFCTHTQKCMHTCMHLPTQTQRTLAIHSFSLKKHSGRTRKTFNFQFQDECDNVPRLRLPLCQGEGIGSAEAESMKAIKAHVLQLWLNASRQSQVVTGCVRTTAKQRNETEGPLSEGKKEDMVQK